MKRVSPKKAKDYREQAKIRKELLEECEGVCMTCGRPPGCFGLALSHIIALGRGGKTSKMNCILECQDCALYYEKKEHLRPQWQKERYGIGGEYETM